METSVQGTRRSAIKWTEMAEAVRGRHGVTSEDSDTERVVLVPKRHARKSAGSSEV
jgi:hypothetical protein